MRFSVILRWLLTSAVLVLITHGSHASSYWVFIAPTGDDANDGLTVSTPKKTLQAAHDHLENVSSSIAHYSTVGIQVLYNTPQNPGSDGRYYNQTLKWSYYNENQTIVIEGNSANPNYYPIFNGFQCKQVVGTNHSGDPVYADPSRGCVFMIFQAKQANAEWSYTNIVIRKMNIENYVGGISFNAGGPYHNLNRPDLQFSHNIIENVTFSRIGDKHVEDHIDPIGGYGAIVGAHVHVTDIKNNTFREIENKVEWQQIHGIYLTHFSSYNNIDDNYFEISSGDPVKFHNQTFFNSVRGNTFINSGVSAVNEYLCGPNDGTPASCEEKYCPSISNRYADNSVRSNYNCAVNRAGTDAMDYRFTHKGGTISLDAVRQYAEENNCPTPESLNSSRVYFTKSINNSTNDTCSN